MNLKQETFRWLISSIQATTTSSLLCPTASEMSSTTTTTSMGGNKWRLLLHPARPSLLASATYVFSSLRFTLIQQFVCNHEQKQYSKRYLEQLLPNATVIPAVNQIENHPSLPQQEIVDFCKENGIHVMAYSPLGSTGSPLMTAEPVVKISEKKGVSAGTVLLSYHGMFICLFILTCPYFA